MSRNTAFYYCLELGQVYNSIQDSLPHFWPETWRQKAIRTEIEQTKLIYNL